VTTLSQHDLDPFAAGGGGMSWTPPNNNVQNLHNPAVVQGSASGAAASADGGGEHASGEELLEAVRARLRKHAVKLWLPPYCVDGNPQPGAVVALLPTFFAERHDSPALLAASEEALVQSLTHLQAHSLKKLQARGVGQAPKAQSTSPSSSAAAATVRRKIVGAPMRGSQECGGPKSASDLGAAPSENDAATIIQATVRRARDLTAVRKDLLERLDAAVQAEPGASWMPVAGLMRLVCQALLRAPAHPARCLMEERVLDVFANVVELSHKKPISGLQLLYLSALHRLVEALPDGALSLPGNAALVKRLSPLHTASHVQWLLCGLGGEPAAGNGSVGESEQAVGLLKTMKYTEWMHVYRDVRANRNTAGMPQFTEGVTQFCTVYGLLLRAWPEANILMLDGMSIGTPVHIALWAWLRATGLLQEFVDKGTNAELIDGVVFLFCRCYVHRLMVTDECHLYDQQFPFPLAHLVDMALLLGQYVNQEERLAGLALRAQAIIKMEQSFQATNRRYGAGEVEAASAALASGSVAPFGGVAFSAAGLGSSHEPGGADGKRPAASATVPAGEEEAERAVRAIKSDVKSAICARLPPGRWAAMTWVERLACLEGRSGQQGAHNNDRVAPRAGTREASSAIDRLDAALARRIHGVVQHIHVQRPHDHHADAAALGSTRLQRQGPQVPHKLRQLHREAVTDLLHQLHDGTYRGVLLYPDKSRYEGSFKTNLSHRVSTFSMHSAASADSLDFAADGSRRHGTGTLIWADGASYEGQWSDNCLHGRGILTLSDGRKFRGSFRVNAPEKGVLEKGTGNCFVLFGDGAFGRVAVDLLQSHTLPTPKIVRELGRIPAPLYMAITVGAASSYRARGAAVLSIADRILVKELHVSEKNYDRHQKPLHVAYGSGSEAPAQILHAFTKRETSLFAVSGREDLVCQAQWSIIPKAQILKSTIYSDLI
jgi:hypothetical protein